MYRSSLTTLHETARNWVYLAFEIKRSLEEARHSDPGPIDRLFAERPDPWELERPEETGRILLQANLLASTRNGALFDAGLEIGCAEGRCTEFLEPLCRQFTACDISPVALARTRGRRSWREDTEFREFDLRHDAIQGTYDLIVVTRVLEYFSRRSSFDHIREKLVAALRPQGLLLLETTEANPVVERARWAKWLIRGQWINRFIGAHPQLAILRDYRGDCYHGMLCQKQA
jgi:SAM-dependent methyltransferase